MSNFEFNKIFAAVLVAGIIAMLAGFVADIAFHAHPLEKDAVEIEGAPVVASLGASAPAGPEPILALLASADLSRGQKLSKACAACHSFDQGGVNKVGPALYGIVGRDIGGHGGFAYSTTLTDAQGDWDYQALNAFLWKPKKAYPGTKMNYAGLKKPSDRAALIAWLRSQGSEGYALPSASAIAAEAPQEETAE